mmetsp:Transcript_28630/g.71867  ORF Transcript_28630/g.71867 Transcript_28630/m.71867 type:complete len:217 (-) Transcript_28630:2082-2732(-)
MRHHVRPRWGLLRRAPLQGGVPRGGVRAVHELHRRAQRQNGRLLPLLVHRRHHSQNHALHPVRGHRRAPRLPVLGRARPQGRLCPHRHRRQAPRRRRQHPRREAGGGFDRRGEAGRRVSRDPEDEHVFARARDWRVRVRAGRHQDRRPRARHERAGQGGEVPVRPRRRGTRAGVSGGLFRRRLPAPQNGHDRGAGFRRWRHGELGDRHVPRGRPAL